MEPISLLLGLVGSGKAGLGGAGLGGAIMGAANLLNGYWTRKHQSQESEIQRLFQHSEREDNQKFQKFMQDRQNAFIDSQREKNQVFQRETQNIQNNFIDGQRKENQKFQREMQGRQNDFIEYQREKGQEFQMEMQRRSQAYAYLLYLLQTKSTQEMKDRDSYQQHTWPLDILPEKYIEVMTAACLRNEIPLQIIAADGGIGICSTIVPTVRNFFNRHYPLSHTGSPTYFYSGAWSHRMQGRCDNAQAYTLFQVLRGLPTLLILPEIHGEIFTQRIGFWGLGDFESPSFADVMTIDMKSLDVTLLRQHANELYEAYQRIGRTCPENSITQIRKEEIALENQLKSSQSQADIDLILQHEFSPRYEAVKGRENLIGQRRIQTLSLATELLAAVMTDYYFLIEFHRIPQSPKIYAQNKEILNIISSL